jgi:4-hydroxy-4-methyl-2-oxoglutarate aldolase
MPRSDAETLRQRFLAVDSATLSDLLEKRGRAAQCLANDIVPLCTANKIAGWAYTIRGQMTPWEGAADQDKMRAIEGIGAGEIAVWSGEGEGVCYFGELLALGMKVRGCAGAALDGGVRDSHWISAHGFPVFGKFRTPVASNNRWKVTGCQLPIFMPGAVSKTVAVNPGDFVLGDSDGVVIVPRAVLDEVLAEAEELTAREIEVRQEIDAGASLEVVLKRYGNI